MKTILLPTDFSDSARNAAVFAVSVFGSDVHLVLINSYEEPATTSASMISLREILHEASVDSLRDELDLLRSELGYPNVLIQTISEYGDPVHVITTYARLHKCDLIVMGNTGASGLKGLMMGSVAAGVIQKSEVPVIAVPPTFKNRDIKKLLFASDLSEVAQPTLPEVFYALLKDTARELTILTVSKPGEELDEKKAERGYDLHVALQNIKHEFDVVEGSDIEAAIATYARMNEMDMVITIPHKSSWFKRLINPSVSKALANHIDVPLLAMPG